MQFLALGAISALLLSFSSRPWGSPYFALVAFVPVLFALTAEKSIGRGAAITYVSALPMFIIGFEGLVVEAPLTYYGVVFTLGLCFSVPGAVTVWLHRRFGNQLFIWVFAVCWVAVETLSGSVELWHNWANPLYVGLSQVSSPLAQVAFWAGPSLVSFCVLALNIGLFFLFKRERTPLVVVAATVLILCMSPNLLRSTSALEPLKLGVVQGQLSDIELVAASFSVHEQEKLVARYLDLTDVLRTEHPDVDLVVWAEAAIGWYIGYIDSDSSLEVLFPQDLPLLTGGYHSASQGLSNSVVYWNGESYSSVYEKEFLVPVFENFLAPGEGYRSGLPQISGQEIGLGICWESLYAELSRQSVLEGADLLTFIADDTFAGQSVTPWGHMRTTSMRAIETGRPAVFASQAGPSGIFSPTGQPILTTQRGKGYWVAEVPQTTGEVITPFVRFGNWFGWGCLSATLVMLIISFYQKPEPSG